MPCQSDYWASEGWVCVFVLCTLVRVWTSEGRIQSSVAMWWCKRIFSSSKARRGWLRVETPAYCKMCWPKAGWMYYLNRRHIGVCPLAVEKLSPIVTLRLEVTIWSSLHCLAAVMSCQIIVWVCTFSDIQGQGPITMGGLAWWFQNFKKCLNKPCTLWWQGHCILHSLAERVHPIQSFDGLTIKSYQMKRRQENPLCGEWERTLMYWIAHVSAFWALSNGKNLQGKLKMELENRSKVSAGLILGFVDNYSYKGS